MLDPIKPFYFDLTDSERQEVLEATDRMLQSGQLMLGPETTAFEASFADFIGTEHAVSTSTGTSALEMIFRAFNIEERKVAVPTNTNFATVAAIMHAGGTPLLLDMDADTFMPTADMLAGCIREHPDLAGAVWVHIGGLIAPDFVECVGMLRERGMFMVEDAAHAHGSAIAEGRAGALGDAAAFSFFPTKVMTTLEGGMITTNHRFIDEAARSLRNQGKGGAKFGNDHTDLGNSWRLLEFAAALGNVQLRKLPDMVRRRETACRRLVPHLERAGIDFCRFDHMEAFSGYKLILRLSPDDARPADEIKAAAREMGVIFGGGVYDKPCHLQPVFQGLTFDRQRLRTAETWCPRHICPPITSGTTDRDVEAIGECLGALFSAAVHTGQSA
ncbi:MAG: DegT/DnrJ/EryC1/StrS family aminotransferase [Planctomycetota bacterium]